MKHLFLHTTAQLLAILIFSGLLLAGDYQPDQTYSGLFVPNRIYKYNQPFKMWNPDRKYPKVNSFTCQTARSAFSQTGTWTGVIHPDGSCGLNEEAPQRATGNYLNYLQTVKTGN